MPLPLPPTILLAVGGLLLVSVTWLRSERWCLLIWLAGCLVSLVSLATSGYMPQDAAARMARHSVWAADGLAVAGQSLTLVCGLLWGIGSYGTRLRRGNAAERFGFLSFQMAGIMLVAAANDALSFALAWEIVQFALIALRRLDWTESEPSRNHDDLWFSIAASLCLWLGIALSTSLTASTQFDEVRLVLTQAYRPGPGRLAIGAGSKLGLLALGLIVAGIGSRLGLVPWQSVFAGHVRGVGYWTAGCIITGGQLAAVLALARLCGTVWVGFASELIVLMIVLSTTTFFVAASLAVRGLSVGEGSLRRWLTTYSMLHGAWWLVGVIASTADLAAPESSLAAATGQPGALPILLFSVGASVVGLTGLFLILSHLERDSRDVEFIDELQGLGQLAPAAASSLLIVVASLTGFPLLWGCWGQWLLVVAGFNVRAIHGASGAAPHQGVLVLVILATVCSLFVMAVTTRFARVMFLDEPISRRKPQGSRAALSTGIVAAALLVALGLLPSRLLIPLSRIQHVGPIVPEETPAGKKTGESTAQSDPRHVNDAMSERGM